MKQYQEFLTNILENGKEKNDRTGVGTKSLFVHTMRFNLKKGFPAMTTKHLSWKSVVTELLWFLEGSGDERRLKELMHTDYYSNKKTIWSQNANADYWKPKGLFDGDLGLIYGNMWRKWPSDGSQSEDVPSKMPEPTTTMNYSLVHKRYQLHNSIDKRILSLWRKMIKKCYNVDGTQKQGLSVSTSWQDFETFNRQIKAIAGFYSWANNAKDFDLDHFYFNAKQFSKSTSIFLPKKYIKQMSKEQPSKTNNRKIYYIDQLQKLINDINENKADKARRLILTAWNPDKIEQMGLPPCHTFSQFEVYDGKLSCMLYCRSQDVFLGTPFNIASYALFTHMIAQVCGLEVDEYIHIGGDCHIYNNHLDAVNEQLSKEPLPLATLKLNANIKNIDDFTLADIELLNYTSHQKIAAPMAV